MIAWEIAVALAKKFFGLLPIRDWLILGAVLGILGYHFYALHERGVTEFARGKSESAAQCSAEKKAAAEDYAKRAKQAEDQKKAQEQEQATELALQGENYAAQLQANDAQHQRDMADIRSGALKLRVAGMRAGAAPGDPSPAPSTAAAGSDGAAGADLPPDVTGRLFALADAADGIVHQLTACQAVITTYLKGQS